MPGSLKSPLRKCIHGLRASSDPNIRRERVCSPYLLTHMRMIDDEGTRVHDHLNPAVVAIEIQFEHQRHATAPIEMRVWSSTSSPPGATTPSMRPPYVSG